MTVNYRNQLAKRVVSGRKLACATLGIITMIVTGVAYGSTSYGLVVSWEVEPPQTSVESSCITCHRLLEGSEAEEGPVHDFGLSVHADAGLDCSDCHGGDRNAPVDLETFDYSASKGPGKGFRSVPTQSEIPGFCGRCHSDPEYMRQFAPRQRIDQENLYLVSGHGRALIQGNSKVATCIDCHSSHQILKASDPRSTVAPQHVPETCEKCHADSYSMAGSNLSTTIGEEYNGSVHGIALLEEGILGAPACNDCHGNHGAVPPGFASVSAVCSQCHSTNATRFQKSPHGPIYEMLGEPQCEVCHGNHAIEKTSDSMLEEDGVCSYCHSPGDAGLSMAGAFLTDLRALDRLIAEADSLLEVAHRKGIEVGEGRYTLRQAQSQLVRGRASVHTFKLEAIRLVVEPGMQSAREAGEIGKEAIDEFARRRGGWGLFLVFCVVVIVGMWILIKRLEGPEGTFPLREPE